MLFREVSYIRASAPCPDPLKTPITTLVEIDANDYATDNVIDCSAVDIVVRDGGTLRVIPRVVNNAVDTDDFGVVLQAHSFEVEQGGLLDLEGQGYDAGQQAAHVGSGKSSVTTCSGGVCGGSGGGHGGAGGRGDPDGDLESGAAGQHYGNEQYPITLGSGGGESATGAQGGKGGGAIKLEVNGVFKLNGVVNASGLNGVINGGAGGGGGAGGSVWVEAGSFEGSGQVSVDGGDGGEAPEHGGGGAGGRLAMRCQTANTFTGTVTVDEGQGGIQDGQVGKAIGPSCYPLAPTNLKQYELTNSNPYTVTAITDGERTKKTTMVFKFNISDIETNSTLYPQVEIKEIGQAFTGGATHSGSGVSYTGTPVEGAVTAAGLSKTKEYKWRARTVDQHGIAGPWVEYEEDTSEDIDFIVLGDPALLVKISGDGQTGTVGQALANPFVVEVQDVVGHTIFTESVTWQVKQGGGSVGSSVTTTDMQGRTQVTLTLGTVAGTNNNKVDAIKVGVPGSPMGFTASADPGPLDHYEIKAPSVALVSTNFSPAVEIYARDLYDNLITSATNNVSLSAVLSEQGCPDTCNPGTGTLTPSQVTLSGGTATIANMQYDTAETIKVKADDGSVDGYSNPISIVTAFGSCFGVANDSANSPLIITENKQFTTDAENGGVINCDQIDVTIEAPAEVVLSSSSGLGLGVTLIAKSLDIQTGASVSSGHSGYPVDSGPGNGVRSGDNDGGSHGGYGQNNGYNKNLIYGSVYEPTTLGSGGQHGGPLTDGDGGGAIKIEVLNTFIHNGILDANGKDGASNDRGGGGGAGGSIWIDADVFNGTGTISTNGGYGTSGLLGGCGGGAGGRIAIYYGSGTFPVTDVTHVQSKGANGHWDPPKAGPGTVYVEHKGVDPLHGGKVYVHTQWTEDSGDIRDAGKAGIISGEYQFSEVRLTNYGDLDVIGNDSILTVTSGSGLQGDNTGILEVYGTTRLPDTVTIDNLILGVRGDLASITDGTNTSNMNLTIGGNGKLNLYAGAWGASQGLYEFDTVNVQSGGVLLANGHDNGDDNWTNDYGLTLDINALTIDNGGQVSADELGFRPEKGLGGGTSAKGGSFGGYGQNQTDTNKIYGNVYEPVQLGSGGANGNLTYEGHGGYGGGAIKVVATTITNNGTISAKGMKGWTNWAGGGSGGSGGSIWIDTDVFNGTGVVHTDGAQGISGQGGGAGGAGGRIGIYYSSGDFPVTNVTNVHSYGETQGGTYAGAGTIYVEQKEVDIHHGAYLFVDNRMTGAGHGKAGLPEADYEFSTIRLTRYGHLDVIGVGSNLYVTDENSLQGDNTSRLDVYGSVHLPDTVRINNLELGVRGDLVSLVDGTDTSNMNITVGSVGKFHLYAWAWGCERGSYDFDTLNIEGGGIMILQDYVFDTGGLYGNFDMSSAYGIDLKLNTLTIDTGGYLNADGTGFVNGGWNQDGSGGSYGGYGGKSSGHTIYGDVYLPRTPGIKGANGDMNYEGRAAAGGGSVEIDAQTMTVNGAITANGATHPGGFRSGGAGSGGSVLLFTKVIEGSGYIRTNGGGGSDGNTGGGSGGRIAVYYDEGTFPLTNVENVQSRGGNGPAGIGGPGTVYLEREGIDISRGGLLYVDNGNNNARHAAVVEDDYQFAQVNMTKYGHLDILGQASTLTITSGAGLNGDATFPDLDVYGTFVAPAILNINGVDVGIRGEISMGINPAETVLTIGDSLQAGMTLYANTWAHDKDNQYTFGSLNIAQFGTMTLVSYYDGDNATTTGDYGVTLNVENLTIDSGGLITANEKGYPAMQGPGGGCWWCNYGASHGGLGGNADVSKINDDLYNPVLLGSGGSEVDYGGYGGKGGGAIHLNVTDTITVNGTIRTNGGNAPDQFRDGSGGAGGTITIDTDVVAGSGLIQANGGRHENNTNNAGGSGGRIAVYYTSGSFPFEDPAHFQAQGGYGSQYGGPGTMYVEQNGVNIPNQGKLYLTNSANGASAGLLEGDYTFELIRQTNYGHLFIQGENSTLTISSADGITGDSTKPKLTPYGTLSLPAIFTMSGVTLDLKGLLVMGPDITQSQLTFESAGLNLYGKTTFSDKDNPYQFGQMIFNGTSSVFMDSYDDDDYNYTDDSGVYLNSSSFIISANTYVSADQQGYYRKGPGYIGASEGTAYGGSGDSTNGYVHKSYGNLYEPIDLGSGEGGGAMKIVTGDFENHGTISANGRNDDGTYNGTGGSIWIDAINYTNDGVIRANGGTGRWSRYPNGSGGRIAIYYENGTYDETKVESYGGGYPCCEFGGPGTIYVEHKGTHNSGAGDLYIKNSGDHWGYGDIFEEGQWRFNDVHIGAGVGLFAESDTASLPEGGTSPDAHELALDSHTVALWHMNELSNDSCAGGKDVCDSTGNFGGTELNGVTIVEGKYGQGRYFGGSNKYVDVGDIGIDGNESRTIELWFYPTVDQSALEDEAAFFTLGADSGSGYYTFSIAANNASDCNYSIGMNYGSGHRLCSWKTLSSIGINQWHHVAVTHNGSVQKFYIDGQLVGTYSSSLATTAGASVIGKRTNGTREYIGRIDEVAVYDRALTSSEIQAHYYGWNIAEYRQSPYGIKEGTGVEFNIDGDFFAGVNSSISGSSKGFLGDFGFGAGGIGPGANGGGGGGYGGAGGLGQNDTINSDTPGGEQYGSAVKPLNIGSGGGSSGTGADGGTGGGAIAIISSAEDGVIQVDGRIYVNGGAGSVIGSAGAGGGAGGSIYMRACDINVTATGILSAAGGAAGDATYDGGGGGGGIISLNHTCASTITIDPAATITVDEGWGYQSGGVGVYGEHGIPEVFTEDQLELDDTPIEVGGDIETREIKFEIVASDPDAVDTLTPQVEIEFAGDGVTFDASNVFTGTPIAYTGGQIALEVVVQANGSGQILDGNGNVLGITDTDLQYGEDYKWRGRVVDGEGVPGDWVEFASNADGTDFTILPLPSCGNNTAESGEECDGTDLRSQTCTGLGYDAGTLSCDGSCNYTGCYNYVCGNGTLEPGEQCDLTEFGGLGCSDFDDFDGGTLLCNALCVIETDGCIQNAVCGNGALEAGEQCDDGNTSDGDGCDSSCNLEGYGGYCGDGITQAGDGEQCDDGNTTSGDGCSNVCQTEIVDTGYCGDGTVNGSEQCDDGNQTSGDGCSNICRTEVPGTGYCGDGTLEGSEQCDDGNQLSGDGCSNVCTVERGSCGNGVLERGEQCDGNELGNETCNGLGFGGGNLTCNDQCRFDTNECEIEPLCGNGVVEPGEQCDGGIGDSRCADFFGYNSGTLSCNNQCQFDLSQCSEERRGFSLGQLPETGFWLALASIALSIISIGLGFMSLILAFPSLLIKDEKNPWGLVFDAKTKKPITFAVVRLYSGGKLLMSRVTDLQGRYGFAVGDGEYELEVSHDKYKMFKEKVKVQKDTAGTVNRDVAMIAIEELAVSPREFRRWIKSKLTHARERLPILSRYFYVFGFVFSIVATVMSPIWYNLLVIAFYVLVGIVHLMRGMKRGWGKIYDTGNNEGIADAFVRVFDAEKNKMVDTQITEKGGRYVFMMKAGVYNLLSTRPGYSYPARSEKRKMQRTMFGNLVQVKQDKEKPLGEELGMDSLSRQEIEKIQLNKGKVPGEEKFGSSFGA